MIRIFYHTEEHLEKSEHVKHLKRIQPEDLLWIDLQSPGATEIKKVQDIFDIDFRQLKKENELESNTRFYETEKLVLINSNFIRKKGHHYESTVVFFYLLNNVLITERYADLASFDETIKKIQRNQKTFRNGDEILELILETKADIDADFIEKTAKEIALLAQNLTLDKKVNKERLLLQISQHQEAATLTRESFIEKQRVASSLLKSTLFKNKERLKLLMHDLNAMIEYSSFVFERMEYLQNTVMGLLNIEQNKTIKIFTIVSVVFMPPTLIASIYGMNFKTMPELEMRFGYPLAVVLMILSSLLTLYLFKRKKWL